MLHRQSVIDNDQSDPDLLLHDGNAIDPALLPLHSRPPDHTQPNVDLNNQNEAGMREWEQQNGVGPRPPHPPSHPPSPAPLDEGDEEEEVNLTPPPSSPRSLRSPTPPGHPRPPDLQAPSIPATTTVKKQG